jgi:hypothetical protein
LGRRSSRSAEFSGDGAGGVVLVGEEDTEYEFVRRGIDTDEDDGPRALARPPLTLPEDFSVSVRAASPLLVLDFSVGARADEAMRWRQ